MRTLDSTVEIIEHGIKLGCGCEVNIYWAFGGTASRGVWLCDVHNIECKNLPTLKEKNDYVKDLMKKYPVVSKGDNDK